MTPVFETHGVENRIYITDSSKVEAEFGWRPRRGVQQVVRDIFAWLYERPDDAKRIVLE